MRKNHLFKWVVVMFVTMCTGFISCDDDGSDNSIGNENLVGTWTRQFDRIGVIGFRMTADGKFYYSEWNKGEEPDFSNVVYPSTVNVTETTIRITNSMLEGYYEEYGYQLSEDGNSLSLVLVEYAEDSHDLKGTFTKVK